MKICPIRSYQPNNPYFRANEAENFNSPVVFAPYKKETGYLDKQFFIANSSINFKGRECSPSNFQIKRVYGINCPCCGQVMLTRKQSNAFVSRISDKTGDGLQKELKKEYRYLRKNEQEIADILIESSKQFPDDDLTHLVAREGDKSIAGLVESQKQVIGGIKEKAAALSRERREELLSILANEEALIDNSDDFVHFKRRNFIDKIGAFKSDCVSSDKKTADEIFEKAQNMPTSGTNKDAFFVKYARRKNEDIARRLILPAMSTTEHIRPQSKNGKNNTDNYIPLCGDCNSKRGNIPYAEWFKIHPEMPQNLQNYIYQVSDIAKDKNISKYWDFYDTYADDVIRAIFEETKGKVKLLTADEARQQGLLADDGDTDTASAARKPKTLDEKREMWMDKYEALSARIGDLTELRNSLYSDKEFLNIIEFMKTNSLLSTAEQFLKTFENNKTQAKRDLNRTSRAYKKALDKGEPTGGFEEKILERQAAFEAAKADYNTQLKRVEILRTKKDGIKARGVVTPDEVGSEISALKTRLHELGGENAEKINAAYEKGEAQKSIDIIKRKIEELQRQNEESAADIDFDSNSSKRAETRYLDLSAKIKMVQEIDRNRFRKFFSPEGESTTLSPDFILDESLAALQKQFAFLMKNPSALYLKREDEIKELSSEKSAYEAKLQKMNLIYGVQKQIGVLEKRKAVLQKKFANINIDEQIKRLQEEADGYLQAYTDSFNNFDSSTLKPES